MTKKEIEFQCQLAYDAKFIELIGKNVGDKVKCFFSVHSGDRKHSYSSSVEGEGTIILDEKGYGVLSDNEYKDSKDVRKNIYIKGATEQRDIDIECAWRWMREHIKLIGCEMELHSSFVKAMKNEE